MFRLYCMLLLKFISLHRSILIPVLLYGWQDNNVVEEEDANDGDDVSSQAPFWKSIVPTRNLHLGWDEEDQPDHDGPGQSLIKEKEQTWRNPGRSLQLRQLSVWRTSRRSWRRRCWTSSGQTRRKVQRYFPAEETFHWFDWDKDITWTKASIESSKRPVGPWAQSSETCQ